MKLIGRLLLISVFCLGLQACFPGINSAENISLNPKSITLNSVEELYQFLTYDENRYPLISAHRGGPSSGLPENAIETFDFQAQKQPLIIECDIRLTKDSVLVLMHDEKLDRTTTGTGLVSAYTLSELKALRLKDPDQKETNFRIPTLEEALNWGKGKVIFTLDVKKEVPYALVSQMVRKTKSEGNSIIITYSADQAAKVYQTASDLMISVSIKNAGDLQRINDRDIPDNRLIAFIGTSEAEKGLYELLHGHGIMCILGTMGNLDRQAEKRGDQIYAEFIANGADIISTDRPIDAGKALNYYIKKRNIRSKFIN